MDLIFIFLKYSAVYAAAMIIVIITVIIEASKPNAPPVNMSGPDIDAVITETSSIGFPETEQPFMQP
jgi:hypothetical protein